MYEPKRYHAFKILLVSNFNGFGLRYCTGKPIWPTLEPSQQFPVGPLENFSDYLQGEMTYLSVMGKIQDADNKGVFFLPVIKPSQLEEEVTVV